VVAFCQRLGLSPKSFYRRRAALRETDSAKGMMVVAPPAVPPSSRPMVISWHGVELTLSAAASPTWIAQLMSRITLKAPPMFALMAPLQAEFFASQTG